MLARPASSVALLVMVASCTLLMSCQSTRTSHPAMSYAEITDRILSSPPSVRTFLRDGPFRVQVREDFRIRVTAEEIVETDVYLAHHKEKAPLVIFQHGNRAHRGVHAKQAERLASWGFHCLSVEQPNRHRWMKNGHNLADLVRLLYKWPKLLNERFDRNRILLVGHSFGGSAISIASGRSAPVKGLILLDPALVSKRVKPYLQKIKTPTILLGADPAVFRSRRRSTFFRSIPSEVMEISIAGATHNDAQYPELFDWYDVLGIQHSTSTVRQELFTAFIVTSAFSLVATESTELAWRAAIKYDHLLKQKRRKRPRIRDEIYY